ncbi:substrate-binding domain-containing protein [Agaribacterium sp. ZY112]|uniref:AraC family transcriptional regulator n=1 Tax=Agaribacterium sp. ZY112 TaxID=3233574 RepID=UPI003524194A
MNDSVEAANQGLELKHRASEPKAHFNVLLALSRYDHRTHKGIAQFAATHNWHLNCDMTMSGRAPKHWQGDGIISLLTEEDEACARWVEQAGTPFVDLSVIREDIPAARVSADHRAIGRTAAEYFLVKGFRHFAFFSTSFDRVAQLRRDSFFEQIHAHSYSISDWSSHLGQADSPDYDLRLRQLLNTQHFPLALFCTRDSDASMALNACLQADIGVPEQVAILGVDNNELITNALRVPLSSVNHDVEGLGYAGASLLHQLMSGEQVASTSPRLIQPNGVTSRRSTDCLAVAQPLVRQALAHINEHFRSPTYSVAKTAEFCGVSRRYLDKLFQQELDSTMHLSVSNLRLREAQNALLNSCISIEQVSQNCGFSRVQYFNTWFKQQLNVTPLTFRKQGRAGR